jgi:hypothetical protein
MVAVPAFQKIGGATQISDLPLGASPVAVSESSASSESLALKVAGWDRVVESDDAEGATPAISINSSWRATWR